jgi:type IV secretion system protein VirD4
MNEKSNMEGMAGRNELRQYAYKSGAFYLGQIHGDHGLNGKAGIDDDRHLFIVAGSRSGKGVSLIIPNLIHWQGPVFCIDPKGENASITAVRRGMKNFAKGTGTSVRSFIGQQVAVLDPFNAVRGPARGYRVEYDPLTDIDITDDLATGAIESVVEAVVISEQGSGAHFSESAGAILAGVIEAVLVNEPPEKRTLKHCRDLILKGFSDLKPLLKRTKTPAGLAQDAYSLIEDVGEEEAGSFRSTLSRQLRWMADPRMQRHLIHSRFSLRRAVLEGWSIYIVIPPNMIPRMKRWLRLIVRMGLDAKMNSAFEHKGPQTLFLLDEFPALGHMQLIEDAAGYMAGYGIKLISVIQNIGQIQQHYGKNWETFLGNAGAIIAWGLNDKETETYIADRIGPVMMWEQSFGESESGKTGTIKTPDPSRQSQSMNLSLRERPIRWPSEIHREGARQHMRAFVVPASGASFTIRRGEYMSEGGKGLFDSPDFIREWEKHHA